MIIKHRFHCLPQPTKKYSSHCLSTHYFRLDFRISLPSECTLPHTPHRSRNDHWADNASWQDTHLQHQLSLRVWYWWNRSCSWCRFGGWRWVGHRGAHTCWSSEIINYGRSYHRIFWSDYTNRKWAVNPLINTTKCSLFYYWNCVILSCY